MKKYISFLLTIMLIFQMLTPAFAYIGNTKENELQENLTILEKLQSLYGEELTEDDIVNELSNMGLLDEEGNLNVSESIMIDGTPMTLEQVKQIVYSDETDLSRVVSVDGTELTLSDLKIMIEIEEELARIKKQYFSNAVPLTEEHDDALNSLLNQIENEGIMLSSENTEIPINHDLRIKVSKNKTSFTNITDDEGIILHFTVVDKNGDETVLDYDISFKLRILDGSAKKGVHYSAYAYEKTVTIPKDLSNVFETVTVKAFSSTNTTDMRWNGEKVFFIQLYEPDNILFEGDAQSISIPVTLKKSYDWIDKMSYAWENTELTIRDDGYTRDPAYYTFAYYMTGNTHLTSDGNLIKLYNDFLVTAEDINNGFENASFEYHPYIILYDPFNEGNTMNSYPMLQDEYWNEISNAEYGIPEAGEIKYYDYGEMKILIDMMSANTVDPYGRQFYFRTKGVLPHRLAFTDAEFTNPDKFSTPAYLTMNTRVEEYYEIIDETAPVVQNITAPSGTYYSGQSIPITVEFSEPVRVNNIRMMLAGESTSLLPVESLETISKYSTFLYTVPDKPNSSLVIDSLTNIVDINNNKTTLWPADGHLTTLDNVEMEVDKLLTFETISFENEPDDGIYAPYDKIEIRLDVNTDISQWLEQDDEYDNVNKQLKRIYIKANGITYPLTIGGEGALEGSYYIATIPAKNYAGLIQNDLDIELFMDGSYIEPSGNLAYFEGGTPVIGKSIKTSIAPIVLVNEVILDTASFPENNMIYLTAEKSIQLNASVDPSNASCKDIVWESSNDSIAEINATTGVISPRSPGLVKFRAVAYNGGFSENPVTAETPEFTIVDGGPPAIVFPIGNNAFYTRKNNLVKILWSQNLINRTEGVPAVFIVEIFDGYYLNKESIDVSKLVYESAVTDSNMVVVPKNILSKISRNANPAYTVRVSAANPDNPAETLSAIGYIIVYPQPAKVKLNTLDSYYITDETSSLNIDWTLSEFNSGDFEFKVVKNQSTIYTDTSGSNTFYILTIDQVPENSLKDIYTVSIKAKNEQDTGYSTDSFVLHVYNKNSMNILVDGQSQDSVNLDNNDYIKNLYSQNGSEGILDLNRDINLKRSIGINYDEFPWGNITDQIKWKSNNSETASIDYKQGTLYENIEKFDYVTYRPSTEFMLAGNSDGTATITATHAATGMVDTLDVNVKTLKDKLYIFNFYPKQETELTYINGIGDTVKLKTNSEGQIAIYEESGIASSLSMKSGNASNLYLGTLYNEKLVSAERDPGKYEPYPVNIFELRPAAKVELFFKNSDGEPYSGQVTYRGAVYKNGKICLETMDDNGQRLSVGNDGRFILNFDTTRFWVDSNNEELIGSDRLEFIYEVIFDDDYYPQLLTVNGNISVEDTVRFGESIINLQTVKTENINKPFVLSHKINYNLSSGRKIDVTNYKGSVGPSNTYNTADLETIVAWWGYEKKDGYDVKLNDEYGALIDGQKVKTIFYPFASLAYTKNITTMSEDSLNLGVGEKKGAYISVFDSLGNFLKQVHCPFMLTNMVGAPSAADEDRGVKKAAEDLNESGNLEFDGSMVNNGDGIIGIALNMMSGTTLGGQLMNLQIIATEDPMIYRGLITMQQGMGSTDASSVTVDIGGVETSYDYTPDAAQMMDLMQKSADDIDKELNENMEKTVSGGVDYGLTFTGYFEVEVRFDEQAQKWIMVVIGGGFDVDALIGYTWTINQMVGPVPLTAEFGIGAAAKLEFRAVKPYGNVPSYINAADVNDFFTALRIKLYVSAFGGFGFDYSIVALKIGVFGKINLDYELEFLTRSYLPPPPEGRGQLYGIELGISGQVGIKFVAKFLFMSYEAVLASLEYSADLWTEGNPEMIEEWKSSQNSSMFSFINNLPKALYRSRITTVKESLGFESRDYLSLYDRSWGSSSDKRSMSISDILSIQTNSYPYSNPVLTRDGSIMAYMSDSNSTNLNETRASWAIVEEGSFIDKGPLPQLFSETEYADNNLKLDGNSSFAAAIWEQQRVQLDSEKPLTNRDISSMINSSDIMASIYDGTSWDTTALTDNLVSDMSPVIAANSGRAIAAWRCLAGSSTENYPVYDDVNDSILYKVFENGSWSSETYTLYNGSSGNVKGLSAAMMPDGTAGIVYTLDIGTDLENPAFGCETALAVINSSNNVIADLRLTSNDSADQNPQITVADFGTEEGVKFIVGWYNVNRDGIADIKLAAVDNTGKVLNKFIDSISSINENSAVNITDSFRFAKNDNTTIDGLTIVWVEPTLEFDEAINKNAENDCLKAVKFMMNSNGRIYLTSALDVATMDSYTLIDHLDAYSNLDNSVNAVMLCSSYDGQLEDQGNGVYTVDSISSIKYAAKTFENNINVKDIYINYNEIKNNMRIPIVFTVTNMGIEPINSINVELNPDNIIKTFDNLNLLPNKNMVLTVDYDVPNETTGIHDLSYTVSAVFDSTETKEKTGLLNLDIPDTGISKVELVNDEQGKRLIQATLHNMSDIPLNSSSNRKVYVGFYTSSEYIDESIVGVQEIAGNNLSLLDEGALTMRFTYNIPLTGIPQGGTRLYGRVWVEENQGEEYSELIEYNPTNNIKSILIPNPTEANNGNQFLVIVEQENDVNNTTAHVTVKNLSMAPSSNGNVIAYLMDSQGNVIETKFLALTSAELLSLEGEESVTRDILFSKLGTRVAAEYFTSDPTSMDPKISNINLDGITINFDSSLTDYLLTAVNLTSSLIVATAKNSNHVVEIRNAVDDKVLASGTGSAIYNLQLSYGKTAQVKITATNTELKTVSDVYNISISSTQKINGNVLLTAPESNYRSAEVLVTAENLSDFVPVKWQYLNNGDWSEVFDWNPAGTNKFLLNGTGTYTVSARLFDENGYYTDSNNISVRILRRSSDNDNVDEPVEPEIITGIFKDVTAGSWYYEAINYLSSEGIINGVGNGLFAPEANIKRADFLIMVMNAYGLTTDDEISDNFADAGDKYYTKYLGTARRIGLVSGTGNNMFAPENLITRQDMAVILYRILDKLGKLPENVEGINIEDFTDKNDIAEYAANAMKQFTEGKIISGYDNRLYPFGLTTRAQAAQILYNLLK